MDQHPIPQDVTGFQFKLIGTMTVKQFGYVAAGVIMAVIIYYLPFKPWSFAWIINNLLIVPVGVSGIIVAFVPIEGRPADIMATNFVKALLAPNQYVYRRTGRQFSFSKINLQKPIAQPTAAEQKALEEKRHPVDTRGSKLNAFLLQGSQGQGKSELDKREQAFFKNISSLSAPLSVQPATPAPTIPQGPQMVAATMPATHLPPPVTAAALPTPAAPAIPTPILASVQPAIPAVPAPIIADQPAPEAPHVRVVPQAAQLSAGLPHIPDTPNVVVGIVKDPRGNVINNILVEIKDKDNNPVRAFKTNAVGQFASATPLTNGIYTIELEDPKKMHSFDLIQLVASNQILMPLEIISHDAREELRKQLFN